METIEITNTIPAEVTSSNYQEYYPTIFSFMEDVVAVGGYVNFYSILELREKTLSEKTS